MTPTTKPTPARRRATLARLIRQGQFSRQEDLVQALARAGLSVTQATLSRDLNSLGVAKTPAPGGGFVYVLHEPAAEVMDRSRQQLDLTSFINQVLLAGSLVVVKTPPGHAHGVGRAIDLLDHPHVVGSVAGDDTVLVITATPARARAFRRDLETRSARPVGAGR